MTAPASILVVRLSAIGDVVLASAVADALADAYPAARREFLAADPAGRVLDGLPSLHALHLWPGGPPPRAVIREEWDVLVDLSGTLKSRRLAGRVPARARLRIRKQTFRRFAFVKLRPLGGSATALVPAIDRMFEAVAPLGVVRGSRRPRFAVPTPPPDGPVLLAPGAGRDTKRWAPDRFRELALRLIAGGERVLVAGSGAERPIVDAVASGTGAEIAVADDPSLLPVIAARAPLAVTNDTAWLHVAEACGADVVAIFGPTHPALGFAPLGPGSAVIREALPCSPCDLHGPQRCPKGHHRCMEDLTVGRVLAAVRTRRGAGGTA